MPQAEQIAGAAVAGLQRVPVQPVFRRQHESPAMDAAAMPKAIADALHGA